MAAPSSATTNVGLWSGSAQGWSLGKNLKSVRLGHPLVAKWLQMEDKPCGKQLRKSTHGTTTTWLLLMMNVIHMWLYHERHTQEPGVMG